MRSSIVYDLDCFTELKPSQKVVGNGKQNFHRKLRALGAENPFAAVQVCLFCPVVPARLQRGQAMAANGIWILLSHGQEQVRRLDRARNRTRRIPAYPAVISKRDGNISAEVFSRLRKGSDSCGVNGEELRSRQQQYLIASLDAGEAVKITCSLQVIL